MGLPKFFWDSGKTLEFPVELSGYEAKKRGVAQLAFSSSGKAGAVFETAYDEVVIEMDAFNNRAFYRNLQAWWAWARQGLEYAFAFDGDDTVNAALDGAAAAGQKVVPLASTTGISAGGFYRLRSADRTKEEIVEVDSVSAGVSVTAVENLLYAYESGDAFLGEDYYPRAVSLDSEFPAEEKAALVFEFKHKFRETP